MKTLILILSIVLCSCVTVNKYYYVTVTEKPKEVKGDNMPLTFPKIETTPYTQLGPFYPLGKISPPSPTAKKFCDSLNSVGTATLWIGNNAYPLKGNRGL